MHTHPAIVRQALLLPLLAALLLGSCASRHWDGELRRSGSLDTATRPLGVDLMQATREHSYGLGILEHAAGVFVVLDGHVSIGRALSANTARTDLGFPPGAGASWMVRASVPRWREDILHEPLDMEGLAAKVADLARREGWEGRPFLFQVEGPLESISLSIVRGTRPGAPEPPPGGQETFRVNWPAADGVLIGVHAPGADGILVLPRDPMRVHALLGEPNVLVGQVDAVRVLPGARIRVPKGK